MTPQYAAACGDFLQHYAHDAALRWSPEDLAAQQSFVGANLRGTDWLDWSTPEVTLQVLQSIWMGGGLGAEREHEEILLAGPAAELLDPEKLLALATKYLKPAGRIVGIIPCLRDNSPESAAFAELTTASCWPYSTAEEIQETLRDFNLASETSEFVAIPRFNEAVLKDQLACKVFRRIFDQLESQGYDPTCVGFGELRFVATLAGEA
jgi:hypothetical protein